MLLVVLLFELPSINFFLNKWAIVYQRRRLVKHIWVVDEGPLLGP